MYNDFDTVDSGYDRIEVLEELTDNEADSRSWRGVFTAHPSRKILFHQTVEVRTEALRRLTPRLVVKEV